MTDTRPDADSPSRKPRGLWSLMGAPEDPPSLPSNASTDSKSSETATGSEDEQPASPDSSPSVDEHPRAGTPRSRSLWNLMRSADATPPSDDDPNQSDTSAEEEVSNPEESKQRAKSLFATMTNATPELTPVEIDDLLEELDTEDSVLDEGESSREVFEMVVSEVDSGDDEDVDDLRDVTLSHADEEENLSTLPSSVSGVGATSARLAAETARKQSRVSLVTGLISIVASAAAMLPQFWSGIPATVLGFAAIIAGYLSLTSPARNVVATSRQLASLLGMLTGTIGIFLGPLLFVGLGRDLRESTGQLATSKHLRQLSGAMDRFYSENDGFPIGGTFARDEAGVIRGRHGWMTFLLPFVGESELYHRIDQSVAFDDPANRMAMGHDVVVYFAAGGDRAHIGQGFAVSHYSGLGGEIDNDSGLSHVGVFERDVSVKKEEITDGLATTIIVGEVGGGYPPWGDPENWRKIGRGLNKDPNGFGSANRQGATFLFADGSVKFFSNKTDPKVLERLSTRDGGE